MIHNFKNPWKLNSLYFHVLWFREKFRIEENSDNRYIFHWSYRSNSCLEKRDNVEDIFKWRKIPVTLP